MLSESIKLLKKMQATLATIGDANASPYQKVDEQLLKDVRMFTRYMKDAWSTPEGESSLLHAMKILGKFKRHENMLKNLVDATGDAPILAACKLLERMPPANGTHKWAGVAPSGKKE